MIYRTLTPINHSGDYYPLGATFEDVVLGLAAVEQLLALRPPAIEAMPAKEPAQALNAPAAPALPEAGAPGDDQALGEGILDEGLGSLPQRGSRALSSLAEGLVSVAPTGAAHEGFIDELTGHPAELAEHIKAMLREDPKKGLGSYWTQNGLPDAGELGRRVGRRITARERDAVWAWMHLNLTASPESAA